LHAKTYIQDI